MTSLICKVCGWINKEGRIMCPHYIRVQEPLICKVWDCYDPIFKDGVCKAHYKEEKE